MRNPSLLGFLAAVEQVSATGERLGSVTGYDALENGVAVGTAKKAGLIADTNVAGAYRITEKGWNWIAAELAPLSALTAALAARGGPHA